MLIFFILLFVNLMVFRLYMTESVIAYGTIVALFLFTKGLSRGGTDYEAGAEGEEDSGTEGGDYLGENEGYQPGEDGEMDSEQMEKMGPEQEKTAETMTGSESEAQPKRKQRASRSRERSPNLTPATWYRPYSLSPG